MAGAPLLVVRWWRRPVVTPLVAGLLAVALLCGVGVVAARGATSTVEHEALRRVRSNADAASREVVRQSQDYVRTVTTWASEPSLTRGLQRTTPDAAAVQDALSTLARSKDSPAAFVTDVRGRIVAIYPPQPDLVGADYSFRDWFHGVSRTGGPYVSSGYESASNGSPQVAAVAAPVGPAGRRLGYVAVLWPLVSVRAVADGARHDDGVALTVTDQKGQALTEALAVGARGEPVPARVDDLTRRALQGSATSTARSGNLVAARPVTELGWTVTATLPRSRALASAREFGRSLLLTVGLSLLLVLLYAVLAVVAARRRVAAQLRAEQERRRLAALFAGSPIAIVEGLLDGTILAVNQACSDLLGYSVDELLAMNANELTTPVSASALQRLLDGTVGSYTTERVFRARDGSAVPSLVSVILLGEPGATPRRLVVFIVDQRRQKADEDALRELAEVVAAREAFLSTLFDTMDVGVLACDANGAVTRVNSQLRALHGLPPGLAVDSMSQLHLAHLDGSPMTAAETPLLRALSEGDVPDAELLILPQDGRPPVRAVGRARPLKSAGREVVGAVVAVHDVTAVRAAEEALRASEERFRRVFDEELTGKALIDADGRIVRANATMARLMQEDAQDLVGRPLTSCFRDEDDRARVGELVAAGDGEVRAEMALLDPGGRLIWGQVAMLWVPEEGGRRILLVQVEDITARRRAEQQLTELALHDDLTGLPNRRLLLERCEQAFAVARSGRGPTTVSVMFVDLDGFKAVNDRAGHEVGDQLLSTVAQDVQRTVRPADTVARVGGDEFVVLLDGDEGMGHLRSLADRVGTTIRRQVAVEGAMLAVSGSIGIARVDVTSEPEIGPDQLLRRADAAMYRAKERGRDRHEVFDAELRDRTEARRLLEEAVRDGVARDRVSLVFQPIVDIDSGAVVGAEALMRLTNSQGRLLPTPAAVVAAESAGLSELLGERVLDLALGTLRTWPEHLTVAVNVSAKEVTGRDFRGRVEDSLRRHDVDPARLVLEITESSILHAGPSALHELERLRGLGVRVAIDDFGTAYATLQNLTTLPVDVLKVDGTFTAGLPGQRVHTAIVHGIASMAYEMDVPCVVEGIETPAQLMALRGMSVQGQGWLWGQPRGSDHLPSVGSLPSARAPRD